MTPRRIAFINPCPDIGGAERALLLLLRNLDRTRYAPSVVCPAAGRLTEALAAIGVPATVIPLGRVEQLSRFAGSTSVIHALGTIPAATQAVRDLTRFLRSQPPDLIHTNGIKAHLVGGICGRILRCPVVWHMRDLVPEGRLLRLFRAAAAAVPHRIIGVSHAVTAQFQHSPAARRVQAVHDAVDLQQYRAERGAAEVRAELGFGTDTTLLAMVAHFTEWKGHRVFLDIVARLARQGLPVGGVIIGGSIYRSEGHQAYETEVRDYCRSLELGERVRFTGYQERVADYLGAADMLIHPPTRPEPFGLAVIEAMALGKPVVAAAAGGVLEIVENGVTGLLAPPGDAAAFAEAARALLCDPARRSQMARAGRRSVEHRFHPAVHAARVERVYREIAA
jgi:glycosyltransferase involved in cell wall biosynthesis